MECMYPKILMPISKTIITGYFNIYKRRYQLRNPERVEMMDFPHVWLLKYVHYRKISTKSITIDVSTIIFLALII